MSGLRVYGKFLAAAGIDTADDTIAFVAAELLLDAARFRLDDPRQVATLGLDDLFENALVLIEWGERFPQLMPARRTEIGIRALESDERVIEVIERS